MGTIETKYDLTKDLTIIKATGKMKADDFHEWTANYYSGDNVTSLHLWDVTEADLSEIRIGDIQEDAKHTKRLAANLRKGGKTAFVTHKDLEYGISRMSEAHSEMAIESIEYQTFRTLNDAMEWLGVGD
jgi:pyruvate formate-lyase activating enzyme-like uncharacterized protein